MIPGINLGILSYPMEIINNKTNRLNGTNLYCLSMCKRFQFESANDCGILFYFCTFLTNFKDKNKVGFL